MVEEQISVYPILVNDQYQNQSEGGGPPKP